MSDWRTSIGRHEDAIGPDFDDSAWDVVSPGWGWDRREGERWFRKEVSIPKEVNGIPISGCRLEVRIVCLAGVELYVDGEHVDGARYWFDSIFPITQKAKPGDVHVVCLRSPKADIRGHFNLAELYVDTVEDLLLDLGIVDARARLLKEVTQLSWFEVPHEAHELVRQPVAIAEESDLSRAHHTAREYDAKLLALAGGLEGLTSYLVGHAHIDMNWLWDYEDTIETCRRTFRSVDRLMDEFPELVFSQSQAAIYKMVEDNDPDLFARIKQRVDEGRWDITASTWVEGDLNMASGESLVRQTTTALAYIEEKFGVTPRIAWCPDTFGHPVTYPQILSKCGIDYYYGHRCNREEPEHLFWWQSPDGSAVLVFNEGVTYNNTVGPDLTRSYAKMIKHFDLPAHMVVFGIGDHGGGPTRRDVRNGRAMNRQAAFPKFRHVRAHQFYDSVRGSGRIPTVQNELNFVFEGCYTTHADIKSMNRRGESMLYETEVLASLASTRGFTYPRDELVDAWRNVLFNQFHDLLDGSAIKSAYESSRRIFEESQATCSDIVEAALKDLVCKGDESLTVINSLGWERTGLVSLEGQRVPAQPSVADVRTGREVPCQLKGGQLIFEATVPAVGFSEYRIRERSSEDIDENGPEIHEPERPGQPLIMENRYFRISVDPQSGTLTSLHDKRLGSDLASPCEPMNVFQLCYERPHGMSAWRIGPISRTENLLGSAKVEISHQGNIVAAVSVQHRFGKSCLEQEIVIHRDIPRIDFHTRIDWQEIGGPDVDSAMLKVAFPLAHSSSLCVREIPSGHIESPTNGQEVPSLTFLELPGEGFGISILNDGKYGHDVRGNTIRLTLLRAAYDPDPLPDIGRHELTYSLYPHPGSWRDAEVWKAGHELNLPMRVVEGKPSQGGSWLTVDGGAVDLSALKLSEDGTGLIARLIEMNGTASEVTLKPAWEASRATKCDLRENPISDPVELDDGTIRISLDPYEIATWKLE